MPRRRLRIKTVAPAIKASASNGVTYSRARGGPAVGFAPAAREPSGFNSSEEPEVPAGAVELSVRALALTVEVALASAVPPALCDGVVGANSAVANAAGPFAPPATSTVPSLSRVIVSAMRGSARLAASLQLFVSGW